LNLTTGAITPQYHVIFDDWFATIANDGQQQLVDLASPTWDKLFGDSTYQYHTDELHADFDSDEIPSTFHRDATAGAMDTIQPPQPLSIPLPITPMSSPGGRKKGQDPTTSLPTLTAPITQPVEPSSPLVREPQKEVSTMREPPSDNDVPDQESTFSEQQPPVVTTTATPATTQRPHREIKAPKRYGYDGTQSHGYHTPSTMAEPTAYKAIISDPDTLSWEEAMNDKANLNHWWDSIQGEIKQLESKGTWVEVPLTEAKTKVLPGTWVLRRKRSPDGNVTKYKGRYCVRGDLQETEDETFAPVAAWSTVRSFLAVALSMGWKTIGIDFSNAFVQAELVEPVWIHLPRGFRSANTIKTCLQLKKSLYGLSVAPKLWAEKLLSTLRQLGFKSNSQDECLLYRKNIMLVVYVDDVGIAAKDKATIDSFLDELTSLQYEFTREVAFNEFLGMKFDHQPDGSINMTQRGLIDKIISSTGMEDSNPNWVPAAPTALSKDLDGPTMTESWNYKSVVGMLLYLSTNSRPDIAYAVSQIARFGQDPRQSHAVAVKTLVRYLKRTREQGTIVKPFKTFELRVYVDADFAGLYKQDPISDVMSARSRTGYIVMLTTFPLIWRSVLQTDTTLSTMHAEYTALSHALRAVIPVQQMLREMFTNISIPPQITTVMHARVFEDNSGALALANAQRLTQTTRYFATRLHHFWEHVRRQDLKVEKIDTKEQRADYFTKGLTRESFERNRKYVQGW
jgi:Reverse transcriptase (RNA-dependent DNA polymerase)